MKAFKILVWAHPDNKNGMGLFYKKFVSKTKIIIDQIRMEIWNEERFKFQEETKFKQYHLQTRDIELSKWVDSINQ